MDRVLPAAQTLTEIVVMPASNRSAAQASIAEPMFSTDSSSHADVIHTDNNHDHTVVDLSAREPGEDREENSANAKKLLYTLWRHTDIAKWLPGKDDQEVKLKIEAILNETLQKLSAISNNTQISETSVGSILNNAHKSVSKILPKKAAGERVLSAIGVLIFVASPIAFATRVPSVLAKSIYNAILARVVTDIAFSIARSSFGLTDAALFVRNKFIQLLLYSVLEIKQTVTGKQSPGGYSIGMSVLAGIGTSAIIYNDKIITKCKPAFSSLLRAMKLQSEPIAPASDALSIVDEAHDLLRETAKQCRECKEGKKLSDLANSQIIRLTRNLEHFATQLNDFRENTTHEKLSNTDFIKKVAALMAVVIITTILVILSIPDPRDIGAFVLNFIVTNVALSLSVLEPEDNIQQMIAYVKGFAGMDMVFVPDLTAVKFGKFLGNEPSIENVANFAINTTFVYISSLILPGIFGTGLAKALEKSISACSKASANASSIQTTNTQTDSNPQAADDIRPED